MQYLKERFTGFNSLFLVTYCFFSLTEVCVSQLNQAERDTMII